MKGNYFLYVGNAYPHKNVEILIRAAKKANARIIFVGREDFFYKRLGIKPRHVTDGELTKLYQGARALVFPSLMEGFGLPVLEALRNNCPVIVSDIPVFRELFGTVPRYFDPFNEQDLVSALEQPPERSVDFEKQAAALTKRFSWRKMAKETLKVYEDCTRL